MGSQVGGTDDPTDVDLLLLQIASTHPVALVLKLCTVFLQRWCSEVKFLDSGIPEITAAAGRARNPDEKVNRKKKKKAACDHKKNKIYLSRTNTRNDFTDRTQNVEHDFFEFR